MIISRVKIIAFHTTIMKFWIFYIARKDCSLYNKQKNTWMFGNTRFTSLVKHDIISHNIMFNTRNALEINLIFPRTYVLFSI